MKLIKQKAEYLPQGGGIEGVYKQIELAGRTCYKSESKITGDSAKPFVERMMDSHHNAMLEHGSIYLYLEVNSENYYNKFEYPLAQFQTPYNWSDVVKSIAARYSLNKYSKSITICEGTTRKVYITSNLRVVVENGWQEDLQFICEPTEYHEKRYTFKLTTSIGVTREMNRHRSNSVAEQSTRYCNFSKEKFGGELTFCIPSWCSDIPEGQYSYGDGYWFCHSDDKGKGTASIVRNGDKNDEINDFLFHCKHSENDYLSLIHKGWQPQQAREVLPLCTATEIVHTAFESDWGNFFALRYYEVTGKAHPNMKELADLMHSECINHGIIF